MRILGHSRALADATTTSPVRDDEASTKTTLEAGEEAVAAEAATAAGGVSTSVGARGPGSNVEVAVGMQSVGSPVSGAAAGAITDNAVVQRPPADRLFELTIKFVGTVGVSILRLRGHDAPFHLLPANNPRVVSQGLVASGTLRCAGDSMTCPVMNGAEQRRVVYGSLDLENMTKALPLEYRVARGRYTEAIGGDVGGGDGDCRGGIVCMEEASALARLHTLPTGSAELVMLSGGTGTLPPASRGRLRFCILFHAFQGIFQRELAVENLSSSGRGGEDGGGASRAVVEGAGAEMAATMPVGRPLYHLVRLFVDDGAVSVLTMPPSETGFAPSGSSVVRLATGSTTAVKNTSSASGTVALPGHGVTSEEGLTDAVGNALNLLDTLSLPVTVAVSSHSAGRSESSMEAPCCASCASGEHHEDEERSVPSLRYFRVLPRVAAQGVSDTGSPSSAEPDEMLEEEDEDEEGGGGKGLRAKQIMGRLDSERQWSGGEPFEMSPAQVPLRASGIDESPVEEAEEPGVLEFAVTNRLSKPLVVVPYSNLPLLATPVERRRNYFDDGMVTRPLLSDISRTWEDGGRRHNSFGDITSLAITGDDEHTTKIAARGIPRGHKTQQQQQRMLSRCGPPVTLAANSTRRFRLGIRPGALTGPLPVTAIGNGKALPFDGFVALARMDGLLMRRGASCEGLQQRHRYETEMLPERVDFSVPSTNDLPPSSGGVRSPAPPPLVKLMRAVGTYCQPRFEVAGDAVVDLGNVGHTVSKRGRRRFEVRLRSLCDMPMPVGMAGLSSELELIDKNEGIEEQVAAGGISDNVPRRKTGGAVNTGGGSSGGGGISRADNSYVGMSSAPTGWRRKWCAPEGGQNIIAWIPVREEVVLTFQLRLSRRRQSWAGAQKFAIRLANLADPRAEDIAVAVHARVVTHLVSILGLDEPPPSPMLLRLVSPETPNYLGPPAMKKASIDSPAPSPALGGLGSFGAPSGGSVRLTPLAIPPLRGTGGRCTGSFQVRNVSDETVSVMLRVAPAQEVAGVLSLGASLQQHNSSTGVYVSAGADGRPSRSVALLPGDIVDAQVECLALPGARLPPELLPPSFEYTDVAVGSSLKQGSWRSGRAQDWGLDTRLMGTVRVEIALEGKESRGLSDELAGGGPGSVGQGEDILIESVALLGSLVPGPTFGLSQTSVTVTLRAPESGGGGGGGDGDGTGPFDQEGPASFFVESFSQSLGPVRYKLACGGRLRLERSVRVAAAEDEGGGRRRPARVVEAVTVVAEPSRGTVSANGKREIVVRLAAAPEQEDDELGGDLGQLAEDGDDDDKLSGREIDPVGGWDDGGAHVRGSLFVSITDSDHPGYPPQLVTVRVEVPPALPEAIFVPRTDVPGVFGASGGAAVVGEMGPGTYGLSNDITVAGDESVRMLSANEASSWTRQLTGGR